MAGKKKQMENQRKKTLAAQQCWWTIRSYFCNRVLQAQNNKRKFFMEILHHRWDLDLSIIWIGSNARIMSEKTTRI